MVTFCPYFPKDVLEMIFSWLPADSLIRFKCVSRFWNDVIRDLIKDTEFVSKHLQNLNNTKSSTSLVLSPSWPNGYHDPTVCSGHRRPLPTSFTEDGDSGRVDSVIGFLNFPLTRHGLLLCEWRDWEVAV